MSKPKGPTLPGDWESEQYERTESSHQLELPKPQKRFKHPAGPGKRADGKLWFEGDTRRAIAPDKVDMMKYSVARLKLDGTELPMRDFRRGDRWLPWH